MIWFPFLRQFGAPDIFFPGAPACTWNCMAHLSSFSPSTWRPWRFLPWSPCLHLKLHGAPLVLFSVNLAPLKFSSLEPLLALETAWRPSRPFLRQFGAPDVFFPGAPACTWNCMAPLSSFSSSIWRPWRFLPWTPCLHLKLHGAPLVLFFVNLAPLTFSSLEPLLALETAWRPSRPFLRQFDAPEVFFPGAPACTWNCMAPLSSFSPSIWRPWCFLPWTPYLHLKLHGAPLVLFFVNLAPLTFSSLEPLLALETAWRPSRPFLRQFDAPEVFFPGAPACTWNCMAPLSSFSPSIWRPWCFLPWSPCLHWKLHGTPFDLSSSIWRPWHFLPWSPCLHLKLHGPPLVLFSVNLAPLTFSSLEPLLALETAWHPSRPFLRQFGAPDVFFPGAPTCTWNCMASLSSFSPSIWRPWRFLPWSPCLHLKLHGTPLVLFFVNLAPLTFSFLEPLLALETAWRPSRPFLRQFGAPDVFFPGAPACTWNCMAPLSSFSSSIWRPWRFLSWSPYLHLKLHGVPLVLFSVNLAHLTFSSLEPLLALETAWRPSRPFLLQFGAPAWTWNCMAPLSSFSSSIWRPWRFLPWSPCLHLKLHGAPLVILI